MYVTQIGYALCALWPGFYVLYQSGQGYMNNKPKIVCFGISKLMNRIRYQVEGVDLIDIDSEKKIAVLIDAAMIIDAMDLLYSHKYDAFALISSDSDFTKLASRLKESEIYVFGVGEKKTPVAFRNACDDFMYTEVLKERYFAKDESTSAIAEIPKKTEPRDMRNKLRGDTKLRNILKGAVNEYQDEEGWSFLGHCGSLIKRQYPDFSSKNYGFNTLSQLVEAIELFEIDRRATGSGPVYVYIKDLRKNL